MNCIVLEKEMESLFQKKKILILANRVFFPKEIKSTDYLFQTSIKK